VAGPSFGLVADEQIGKDYHFMVLLAGKIWKARGFWNFRISINWLKSSHVYFSEKACFYESLHFIRRGQPKARCHWHFLKLRYGLPGPDDNIFYRHTLCSEYNHLISLKLKQFFSKKICVPWILRHPKIWICDENLLYVDEND